MNNLVLMYYFVFPSLYLFFFSILRNVVCLLKDSVLLTKYYVSIKNVSPTYNKHLLQELSFEYCI